MPADRRTERVAQHYRVAHENHLERGKEEDHLGIHAGYYETGDETPGEAGRAMRERLQSAVGVDAGDRVLDVGCGFGDAAVWLADTVGASVVGIDIVEEQLAVARETAADEGVADRTRFVRDDFHEMDAIENDAVDVVWGCEALCHARSDRDVVEQAARVLAGEGGSTDRSDADPDDGRIVVADTFRTKRDLTDDERAQFETLCEGYVADFEHIDDLMVSLSACGFEDVELDDVTDAVLPALERRRRRGVLLEIDAERECQHDIDGDGDAAFAAALRNHHHLTERGVLGYFVVSARLA
jgi:ubiquinone/menaquinone biosynthesis C-methylase UbiE